MNKRPLDPSRSDSLAMCDFPRELYEMQRLLRSLRTMSSDDRYELGLDAADMLRSLWLESELERDVADELRAKLESQSIPIIPTEAGADDIVDAMHARINGPVEYMEIHGSADER